MLNGVRSPWIYPARCSRATSAPSARNTTAPGRELRPLQMARNVEALDPRGHDDLAAAAALGAEQQNLRHSHAVGAQMLRDRRNVRRASAFEYPPDPIQPANRVEHFEIRGRTSNLIEMLEPRLGMTRSAYARRQRAVDRGKCGIDQALAKLFRISRVVIRQKKRPSSARQRHAVKARHPPAHRAAPARGIASARLTVTPTSSGDIRRMHSRPIGH